MPQDPHPDRQRVSFVALLGPTASGKTALALELAERLPIEVVSMDSRQLYRGMDVGTAKPTAEETRGVPHHGFDLVDPDQRFSAGDFARFARPLIREIRDRGRIPLLVGGTGFFLRALTHPIFREPRLDPGRREALRNRLEALPDPTLHRWLRELDPVLADRLRHWGGRQRLLRALELPLLTGRPLSWWQRNAPPEAPPLAPLVFVLDVERAELDRRIDERVGHMVEGGLLEEVRGLMARGLDERSPGMRAHGYQEVTPFLRAERTLDEALDTVRRATRAYARRQLTWFRNQLQEDTVWLDGSRASDLLADEIASVVRSHWPDNPLPDSGVS